MVLVLLIALVGGIWVLVAQPWRGAAAEPGARASAGPSLLQLASSLPVPPPGSPDPDAVVDRTDAATAAARPSATPLTEADAEPEPAAEVEACATRDVTVEAVADKGAYATGENPEFTIRLTNDGETDCAINVGTTTQVFTVTSGEDTWWRSTDCQTEPSDMYVTLASGQSVESAEPLVWDRTRSSVDSCGRGDRARAAGGGATYWLDVEIGGIPSLGAISFQLF